MRFLQSVRTALVILAVGAITSLLQAQTPRKSDAAGQVYFVSPKGNDEGSGDQLDPFQTFAKALAVVRPGDTIRIRAGRYQEKLAVNVSGAEGRPITIEGERGPKGERLTELDPSVPLTAKWVPAPEVGQGVYKMPFPGFEPFLMLVDGKFIPRIWPDHMKDGLGFKKLSYPPDQKVVVRSPVATGSNVKGGIRAGHGDEVDPTGCKMVSYWDAMGAMFGCNAGTVYIRFRDRDDPNTRAIRIAPKGGGVEIVGHGWIVLRDLIVQGGQMCIAIRGPNAEHNVVENCRLVNASERVSVTDASHTIIRNNDITAEFYSDKCLTGAWGDEEQGGDISDELGLKYLFYAEYKLFFGPNSTSDYGIHLSGGTDNEIVGNRVSKGGQGIHISRTANARIHGNTVEGMSSIGIIPTMNLVVNVQIYDNRIMDCNIGCRIHHVNEVRQTEPRSVFVYRNRFWQKPGVGTGVFFHYHDKNDADPYLHPDIAIYHNTFAGGRRGMQLSSHADRVGGVPNALVVNNVFSNPLPIYAPTRFMALGHAWAFDYNWLGGTGKPAAVWYGPHNVDAKGQAIWNTAQAPQAGLPAKSTARQAGLDISKPFTLAGKTHDPLPGFAPGYFTDSAPDLGAPPGRGIASPPER